MAQAKRPSPQRKLQAERVVAALARLYPDVTTALVHRDPFELLVATVLSAQCTDVRVNLVTPALFARCPDARSLAGAETAEVEDLIRSINFYRAKAKNLVATAGQLVEHHGGAVPRDLDALTALPGVGRKTANVVLGTAFGIASGVVVDTHVKRLSFRLGLTKNTDPVAIERDLMAIVPSAEWVAFSHRLIWHGRALCTAARPKCSRCVLADFCPKRGVRVSS